jgi:hypothetical protein
LPEAKDRLDAVQATLAPFLARRGFRKGGRSFRRSTEPGVVQLINLQAGMFELSPPVLTANLYGKFTVNVGVAISEVFEIQYGKPFKPTVQEHECAINARLGELLPERRDVWWDLDDPKAAADEVLGLMIDYALPFLERFGSRAAVREQWIAFNESEIGLNHVPRMTVALLELANGHPDEARRLLEEQLRATKNPRVQDAMRRLAEKHGLGPLREDAPENP